MTEENMDPQAAPAAEQDEAASAQEGKSKRTRKPKAEGEAQAPEAKQAAAAPAAQEVATAARRRRTSMGGPGGEVRAIAKWVRMSPRKARRVVDLIRNKPVDEARIILNFLPQRAAQTVLKVLDSAVANAEHNKGMNRRDLRVKAAFADGGPVLKRFQPHAQGRAFPIKKRLSHITVVVGK